MTTLGELTPRQIAVAALLVRKRTTKQIAAELSISEQRVRVLIASVAFRTGCACDEDERIHVALWYRSQVPVRVHDPAA